MAVCYPESLPLTVAKLMLGLVALISLLAYYFLWGRERKNVTILSFYAASKTAKNNLRLGAGLLVMLFAWLLDVLVIACYAPVDIRIYAQALEILGLAGVGYATYRILRVELPRPSAPAAPRPPNKQKMETRLRSKIDVGLLRPTRARPGAQLAPGGTFRAASRAVDKTLTERTAPTSRSRKASPKKKPDDNNKSNRR